LIYVDAHFNHETVYPPSRPNVVLRPRLSERLNEGLHRKLTLISAPAGFGKTTLLSEWVASCQRSVAWLSLDEGDNDPTRFLAYLVAALQIAALSMQGQKDTASFIQSFAGSHHFVMDYLLEEVLKQQPESVQTFLLRTSILDRLCGRLCDTVLLDPSASGQETLEYLERANLFIVPLDNERRWSVCPGS
jgi:ATP/maltotriose-dependent transcriptional regulator MalT